MSIPYSTSRSNLESEADDDTPKRANDPGGDRSPGPRHSDVEQKPREMEVSSVSPRIVAGAGVGPPPTAPIIGSGGRRRTRLLHRRSKKGYTQ
jgi:hypothetical protein